MSELDRRKFLRVLFEANFEVRTAEWNDKEATGLDISLNGCRFNCKKSMSDGEIVSIFFKSDLELEGSVRWCWPIEWYFQTALHFEDISKEKQAMLKAYIEEVTGGVYQMQKDEETTMDTNVESVEILEEDLDNIDDDLSASIIDLEDNVGVFENDTEKDEMEELPPLEEEDLLNIDMEESIDGGSDLSDTVEDQADVSKNATEEGDLEELPPLEEDDLLNINIEEPIERVSDLSNTKQNSDFFDELEKRDINTLSFAGKKVVLYDLEKNQAELLNQYLSKRAGMEVEYVTKKENLWRLMKIDPMDLVIIETGETINSDALEVMQHTKDQFSEVKFICISGPISLERRLQFLNEGALDYLIRPVHLSTIAQSVLVHLSQNVVVDTFEDINHKLGMMTSNEELQEELKLMTEQRDMARADAKENAVERDEALSEAKELEQKAHNLTEEKESLYSDETFKPDNVKNSDSFEIYPLEDLEGNASLLDEDLNISEEVDLIEEDY